MSLNLPSKDFRIFRMMVKEKKKVTVLTARLDLMFSSKEQQKLSLRVLIPLSL